MRPRKTTLMKVFSTYNWVASTLASLLFCQEQNGNASVDCLSCQQCCLNFHASNHSHEDKIGQVRQTSLTANKRINDK